MLSIPTSVWEKPHADSYVGGALPRRLRLGWVPWFLWPLASPLLVRGRGIHPQAIAARGDLGVAHPLWHQWS